MREKSDPSVTALRFALMDQRIRLLHRDVCASMEDGPIIRRVRPAMWLYRNKHSVLPVGFTRMMEPVSQWSVLMTVREDRSGCVRRGFVIGR